MQGQGLLYCFALLLALSSSYSAAAAAAAAAGGGGGGLSSEAPVVLVYLNNKSKVGSMLMDRIRYEAEWGVAMDDTEMGRRILAGADPPLSYNALRADKPAIQTSMRGNSYTRGSGGNSHYRR